LDEPAPHPEAQVPISPGSEDRTAAALRGFGPLGLLAIAVILAGDVLLSALGPALVLIWAKASNTPWRELGFVRPRSWTRTVVGGLLFGAAFKLAMKSVVMPLLGADPINHTYHFLVGNPAAALQMSMIVIFVAGFGEETFYRGYMFERLGKLLGKHTWASVLIVAITTALFALAHIPDQGIAGAEQALFTGCVFGTIFAVTRSLALVMVAHAAFDLMAIAIIYANLETKFAHFIFK
jgi:membrane protease YdiL (CAAX protease family)